MSSRVDTSVVPWWYVLLLTILWAEPETFSWPTHRCERTARSIVWAVMCVHRPSTAASANKWNLETLPAHGNRSLSLGSGCCLSQHKASLSILTAEVS